MVRTLDWNTSDYNSPLNFDDVNTLLNSLASGGVQLFPNLMDLRIGHDEEHFNLPYGIVERSDYKNNFKIIMALLPQALSAFQIAAPVTNWRGNTDVENEILTPLSFRCRALENLSLFYHRSFDAEPCLASLNDLVRNATKLSHLVIRGMTDPLQQRTADHLATQNTLRHLECTPLDNDEWPLDIHVLPLPDSKILDTGCFGQLEVLSLYLFDWECAVCLIRSMNSSPLAKLKLTMTDTTKQPTMLTTFVTAISKYSPTLTHLTLRDGFQDDFFTTEYTMAHVTGTFKPLFELRGLQELDISMSISYYLDGPWLTEAADSWHDLRTILITEEGLDLEDPIKLPTRNLADLAYLLRKCPKIHDFRLSIVYGPVPFELYADIRKMNILYLNVEHSFVGSPNARQPDDIQFVFRCLVGMFPLLVAVCPSDDLEDNEANEANEMMAEKWNAIGELLNNSVPSATLDGELIRDWDTPRGIKESSVSHFISGSN